MYKAIDMCVTMCLCKARSIDKYKCDKMIYL